MEDKVSYRLVGIFVLVLGAALVAGVLWLAAGINTQKHYGQYQSIVQESVAGLNIDAPVRYLGVDVGKVSGIRIDPQNSRQVLLGFLIERGTPIKQDSEAVLKTQGVTGIDYVEISGGSEGSPPLVATAGAAVPMIRSKPSLSARLEDVLTNALATLDRTSANLNSLLDSDNRAALKATLADIATFAHALAEQKDALADAARTAHNAARASDQLGPAIERIRAGAEAVEKMADVVAGAGANAEHAADAVTLDARHLNTETLPELDQSLAELKQLATSMRRLSEQTERNPTTLLLGGPAQPLGPGETEKP